MTPSRRTVAAHLVDALLAQGVDHVFCVPGESYLAVLDALVDARDRIRVVTCRHEAAAANMAEAYGKLTGRPGVCFVTRGPGATHAAIGVHTAQQDSTPLVLFVGQVARDQAEREAFQEIDYRRVFGSMTKWVAQLDHGVRAGEFVARAFATAMNGRPGPVVVALPEDVLDEECVQVTPPRVEPVAAAPAPAAVARLAALLAAAERPLLVAGGSGWTPAALADLRAFVERHELPVALSFRRKDLLDNDSPSYVGDLGFGPNPRLVARLREADLLLAIGARLGEVPTGGYSLLEAPVPRVPLVHAHVAAEELGRVYAPTLAIHAAMPPLAAALAGLDLGRRWGGWTAAARAEYEAFTRPLPVTGALNLAEVFAWLAQELPRDAIVTNGAGNYAAWLHRFYRHRGFRTQLAPTSGAMGYGVPAAIAAKIVAPARVVVCAAGDGCFLMSSQELATAVQYDAAVVFLVVNNGAYGTIRAHQERHYPGRVSATELRNPDFVAYAESFGALGLRVRTTAEFPAAFRQAVAAGRPALIELIAPLEDIAPGTTITALRAASGHAGHPVGNG